MGKTGNATLMVIALAATSAFAADPEFYMTTDRNKVGTEDTFRVEIVIANAPQGASLQLPSSPDFEVLSRSSSSETNFTMGAGGSGLKQILRYTLIVRANRVGKLALPPAELKINGGQTLKTDSIQIDVVKGRTQPDTPPRQANRNPFGLPPGFPQFPNFPFDDDDDPLSQQQPGRAPGSAEIPRAESDLFLRLDLDKSEASVGEQVTMTLTLYSRIDVSQLEQASLPKVDGFWTTDFPAPTRLTGEQRVLDGVAYQAYVIRQKALFAMKPGTYDFEPAEADVIAGIFFNGYRLHRKSQPLKLKIRPLPNGVSNVGKWRITSSVTNTDVTLGEAVQYKIVIEGKGNLQTVQTPTFVAPAGLKMFDPQTSEKPSTNRTTVSGMRTTEYVIVPQQTGAFTLPALTLRFYNPETKQVEESITDPITLNVRPSTSGQTAIGSTNTIPIQPGSDTLPKNQLVGGGLKQLRHTPRFTSSRDPLWKSKAFIPLAVTPVGLATALLAFGFVRRLRSGDDKAKDAALKAKAARKRLAAAEKLLISGSTGDFYAEVERALFAFLEAKMQRPVVGLTHADLDTAMTGAGIEEPVRKSVIAVLEGCDLGRYAPGLGDNAARKRAIENAVQAMEAWPS